MTRVLILCEYFPPENKIGAIRPAKIAKYLSCRSDTEITVVCAMPITGDAVAEEQIYNNVRVLRLNRGKVTRFLHRTEGNKTSGKISGGQMRRENLASHLKRYVIKMGIAFRDRIERDVLYQAACQKIKDEQFDTVFSTFNTDFGHRVAKWYKLRQPNVRWIADFRDPTWTAQMTEKQREYMKTFAADVAHHCDVITAVTPGIVDAHKDDFAGTSCHVIYNGYDPDDKVEKPAYCEDGIFRLVYTGELYSGRRDLTAVFRALSWLVEQGKIDPDQIEIVYAGKSGKAFEEQASRYEKVKIRNVGFVSRAEALALQGQAQVLLLSSWCSRGDKYTLTGKFFEYLNAGKPVICTISGDECGSALAEAIAQHELGICYEEAKGQEDFDRLCAYLEEKYGEYMSRKELVFEPDLAYVQQFSYEKIAEQVYTLIRGD